MSYPKNFDKKIHKFVLKKIIRTYFLVLFLLLTALPAFAQFEAPQFEKVTHDKRAWFNSKFKDIKWTGQGLYEKTKVDDRQTNKLRARLQTAFGDPTQTLEDLINKDDFRPGKAIEFEYWFTVNDSIPMMVLDVDGPFGRGLVFGGASRYIDLMPQIKRAFSKKLMSFDSLDDYQDYFYSPERKQWFNVTYRNGKYKAKEIDSPKGMTIDFDH